MWLKDGQILPGILGRGRQLKDALVFGSDSNCSTQFKFTVAGRKSVNAKVSKVFVNTLLCCYSNLVCIDCCSCQYKCRMTFIKK